MKSRRVRRILRGTTAVSAFVLFIGAGSHILADCSAFDLPFTDLGSTSFCAEIAEAYFSGLTNGTSATGYSPTATVTREQMAAFVTRTLDQSLLRGSRRASLGQSWNSSPHYDASLGLTSVGSASVSVQSDGVNLWVANSGDGTVSQVRASDGSVLQTWTGATSATSVLVAMGRVFVDGGANLYMIDPSQAGPAVTTVISAESGNLPSSSSGMTFDGNNIFIGSFGGAISIVTPGTWAVTAAGGSFTLPQGFLFDGSNVWVTDDGDNTLRKLDAAGNIVQSIPVGSSPQFPIFDGHNIWVPNESDNSLTVVRASDGTVLKTFSAGNGDLNGLSAPVAAVFDGERVAVANSGSVSLFHATDLAGIGSFATTGLSHLTAACSDGVSFWVADYSAGKIGRF